MKYYHATLNRYVKHTILTDGIKPGIDGRVYLSETPEEAAAFEIIHAVGLEQFTVIEIETSEQFEEADDTSGIDIGEVMTTKTIAPHAIKHLYIYCDKSQMSFDKTQTYGYSPIIFNTCGKPLEYVSGKKATPGIYVADVAPGGIVTPISRLANDIDELNRMIKGALKDLKERRRDASVDIYR